MGKNTGTWIKVWNDNIGEFGCYCWVEIWPGMRIETHAGGVTEEGFSRTHDVYTCEQFDDGTTRITRNITTNACDCDGPLDTYNDFEWNAATKEWDKTASSQRDHFAERAGY